MGPVIRRVTRFTAISTPVIFSLALNVPFGFEAPEVFYLGSAMSMGMYLFVNRGKD